MGFFTPNVDKLAKEEDVAGLLEHIAHRKSEVRLQVLKALAKMIDRKEVRDKLRVLLYDPDTSVRTTAVSEFARLGEEGIFENLKPIIIKGSRADKLDALRILGYYGTKDDGLSHILAQAINDKSQMVQVEAIKTMGALKDAFYIRDLVEKLGDKAYQVRLESARSLGKIGAEPAINSLISALVDNNGEVRKIARQALESIGTEKARSAFENAPFMLLVKRMNEGSTRRQETARHIGKHKIKEGLPLLLKTCHDEFKSVRIESLKAIGQLRDVAAVSSVVKLLDDPYFDTRIEVVKALEKLNDPGALSALEKAMEDTNTNVKNEAVKSYYSLKGRLEQLGVIKD
ncbi:MAG: HEAT repeat domain-containing protein [bacterium]|nr:HEAT repeat domain-containing protein [bacterium]